MDTTDEHLDILEPLTIAEDIELPTPALSIGSISPTSSLSDESEITESKDSANSIVSEESDNLSYSSDEDDYLKKFDDSIRTNIIGEFHREMKQTNYDEISALTKVVRDKTGNIIDSVHTTVPFLTKFERAKLLGLRAKQLNNGADPFIKVPDDIIEGHIIAEMELKEMVLPFIISRPLPNGKNEYWNVADLELIDY